ncbi:MAG: RDD family protein [Janthinobacterium lividum]
MSREILVVTPENIEIEYELAGIGSRFLANLLDSFFQTAIYLGLWIIVGIVGLLLALSASAFSRSLAAFFGEIELAFALIAAFVILWGYFIWFETRWNGQTPGKRQLGLRVIRDGGYPINVSSAIIRNLVRIMDGMPIAAIGLITIGVFGHQPATAAMGGLCILIPVLCLLLSARYQRIGDFIAGTLVVKQRAPRVPTLEALAPPPRVLPEHLAPYALADIGRQVYEMTVPEYRAVRHYIDRRWQLPPQVQQTAAMRLAVPLMQRLGIVPPAGIISVNYADLLEYLAVAFEQYRGVK